MKVALSLGDPWGIGPEIAVRALLSGGFDPDELLVFGSAAAWRDNCRRYDREGMLQSCRVVDSGWQGELIPGNPPPGAGKSVLHTLEATVAAVKSGEAGAIVTAPVNKEVIQQADPSFIGHTEYLGKKFGVEEPTMFFSGPQLEVGLATTHVSLRELPGRITRARVLLHLRRLQQYLEYSGRPAGTVGVCGLNPHAGEGGAFGREELDEIAPAVADARNLGINAVGPLPADTLLKQGMAGEFDLVLAMFHDQALTLFKATDEGQGVNISLGLPVLRTSPDHGTAYDLAGSGKADPASMEAALRIAWEAVRRQ